MGCLDNRRLLRSEKECGKRREKRKSYHVAGVDEHYSGTGDGPEVPPDAIFLITPPLHAIHQVWSDNLLGTVDMICKLRKRYPYIALDTEFPGLVAEPSSTLQPGRCGYDEMRINVDMLKMIQLGLAFFDEEGNRPPGISCFQFNFHFDLRKDCYFEGSADFLERSGLDFKKHMVRGIDQTLFAHYMHTSGLFHNGRREFNNKPHVWITFHGLADIGYLYKLMSGVAHLPRSEEEFVKASKILFPTVYDTKHMLSILNSTAKYSGLQGLAASLWMWRTGCRHQAGPDALLTGRIFFRLSKMAVKRGIPVKSLSGILCGFKEQCSTEQLGCTPQIHGLLNNMDMGTDRVGSRQVTAPTATDKTPGPRALVALDIDEVD